MIFAVFDYIHFRRRSGRYTRDDERMIFSYVSWSGSIPEGVWRCFHPGTIIGTANFGSAASWLIMYATNGFCSHVATYLEAGRVIHAVPKAGVVVQPIEVLFGRKIRLNPMICLEWFDFFDPSNQSFKKDPAQFMGYRLAALQLKGLGAAYSHRLVILKAARIFLGRDWELFRFKFLADTIITVGAADLALYLASGRIMFWPIPIAHGFVVAINRLRYWLMPPDVNTPEYSTPSGVLQGMLQAGWRPLPGGEGQERSEQV